MSYSLLDGIRVTEIALHGTGPYCAMLLSFLGAQVIKIEHKYVMRDITRLRQPWGFHEHNFNKLSVTLDLKQPEAAELAKKLVKISDVVVENFRPGVMERFGLHYDVLRQVKPDIIMISCSGFGQVGPESRYATVAGTFAASGGLSYITGYPDGIPTEQRTVFDLIVGQYMAFSVISALLYRKRTGKGQYIDFSAREAVTSLIGDVIMDYTMNGRIPSRKGNQDDVMAPHNCYRCKGDDNYVSIAVANDVEWQALCQAMDRGELGKDERFCDLFSRKQNEKELDRLIGEWTANQTHFEVTEKLQRVGVAAFPVVSSPDVFNDPHLWQRGFLREMNHPEMGRMVAFGHPWRFPESPYEPERFGPGLGEHTNYVLGKLLGVPQEEIKRLEKARVI